MNDDLISRKALYETVERYKDKKYHAPIIESLLASILCVIENATAVDAEPVKYGKWRKTCFPNGKIDLWPPTYECSECNSILFGSPRTNYCPNCGAKMDKEKKT